MGINGNENDHVDILKRFLSTDWMTDCSGARLQAIKLTKKLLLALQARNDESILGNKIRWS